MAKDEAPGFPLGADGEQLGADEAAAYRAVLANRRFRPLFWAMLTSSLGDWIGFFAIVALTERVLGGQREAAFGVAGVLIARVLPALLLGTVAGVLTDRWDRKKVMIWTDIGRGLIMFALAFAGDIFQLFVLTLVIEMMSALFIPAKDATVPSLVDQKDLTTANQMSLVATYGTFPIGSLLFALLAGIGAWLGGDGWLGERPAALAIWLNAGTFFASAFLITRVQVPRGVSRRLEAAAAAREDSSSWQQMTEGFRFIAGQPLVRALIVGIVSAMLAAGVVMSVGKFFAERVNAGEEGFGILGTAVGVGLLIGILASGRLVRRLGGEERVFAPGIGVAGAMLVLTALAPRFDLALIPATLMGAGAGAAFVVGYTMLQKHSTEDIRGRTFAAFNAGVRLALFGAFVVGPVLMGIIGPEPRGPEGVYEYAIGGTRVTLIFAGLVAVAGAVWTGRSVHKVLSDPHRLVGVADPPPRPARVGVFIAFEGGEGAGKSTQIELLRRAVKRAGFKVLVTREPGGTAFSEALRRALLDPSFEVDARAEALTYAAARAQHVAEVIAPALDEGVVVLCDRFIDSSVVYQGVARELGAEFVENLSRWATRGLVPDRIVLLDIDAEVGLARAGDAPDRLESAGLEFHRMVNQAYRDRAAADPGRHLVLDATLDTDEIAARIATTVLDLVEEHTSTMDLVAANGNGNGNGNRTGRDTSSVGEPSAAREAP